jgi:serine/threonine-protein kinase
MLRPATGGVERTMSELTKREPQETGPEMAACEGDTSPLLERPSADRTMTIAPYASTSAPAVSAPVLPARYRDLGRIAAGSFGEIRRVLDTDLDRVVAMKLLRETIADVEHLQTRFLAEAKLTAGLEHPGIVGVHDRGRLDDGRLWFTMREVRGRTLGEVIDEVHAAAGREGFRETASGWTFRRLVDAFARVCQAVAYAHRRGVVHRDLKPDNLMVGELGEALVMDWGLSRRVDAREAAEEGESAPPDDGASPQLTRAGDVLGTPAFMPPEQARGQRHLHGLPSDVYSLGAVLYQVLAGRPPYEGGSGLVVLRQVLAGPPVPVVEAAGDRPVPAELAAICAKAMEREIASRHPDAGALAAEIVSFLDGARRQEQALSALAQAETQGALVVELRDRAEAARIAARKALSAVRPSDPVESKIEGWTLEDEAERLERDVALRETEWLQGVQGALAIEPGLPEAHAALADHYRDKLRDAELSRRAADAGRFELLLRAHDRGRHAAFLRGDGALTLVTDPPGARVTLHRYALRERRLVAERVGEIGPTPILEMPLPHGSYLLTLTAPGRAGVRYPVLIERDGHWDGRAPGDAEPFAIRLPGEGEIGPDEVYIPAGYAWTGGDPGAADSLPRRRIWIDGFVLRRYPVTNRELLEFLADVAAGGIGHVELGLPPSHPGVIEAATRPIAQVIPRFSCDQGGRFVLLQADPRAASQLEWPAIVDGYVASAHARWLALRTGKPWRLPDELEREKASRGADARHFPWGDHAEPAFARVLEMPRGEPAPGPVGSAPADEGPYGARDLAGNVRDWCANPWNREGPRVEGDRLCLETANPESDLFWGVRGGGWGSSMAYSRAAERFGSRPGVRKPMLGVRPARAFCRAPGALR